MDLLGRGEELNRECSRWRAIDFIYFCNDQMSSAEQAMIDEHINYCFACQLRFIDFIEREPFTIVSNNTA
jgi:hypothetical protein